MKEIFDLTYRFLMFLSRLTGFSYKEINIIVWFIVIPFSWAFLIDKIREKHYFKIGFALITTVVLIFTKDFQEFSNTLFEVSANFLRRFDGIGSNYITSSVIICLLIPCIIYIILIRKAYFKKSKI
ncbi:hypothetical protein [uncultured Psychroserpens sp.]|uniref:hypothetical protein n=1 Tax=uncultured Psychroserpens sp. TaxID=255436 RepID=UPI00261C2BBA|nr:hypothetical protein [uncultured Psychroserpens sp.]